MLEKIFSLALSNGLWAALFCLLFLYQLHDSKAREKKYTQTIDYLSASLLIVKEIKADFLTIDKSLKELKLDCDKIKTDSNLIKQQCKILKQAKKQSGKKDAVEGKNEL